ncbi:MAG: hypothetical protein JXA09_04260 [Anaerolineae bacterium]|nr:hypothetical protein [Anaerolineae bacterium]
MRSPIAIGLLHPLNLGMLGLAIAAGLLSAWWLTPVGLALWAVMVSAVARDPEVQFRWRIRNRAPLARRFRRYFERVAQVQLNTFNSLNAISPPLRRTIEPVREAIDELAEQAHGLCVRMTALENYRLVSTFRRDDQADQRQIDAALVRADDPLVAREYAESQRALDKRMRETETIARHLDRVEAQLLSLANEMDAVYSELVRLQALQPADAARYVPRLTQRLRSQAEELAMFEREATVL